MCTTKNKFRLTKSEIFSNRLTYDKLVTLVEQILDRELNLCTGCGKCCFHGGEIHLTDVEYERLKDAKRVNKIDGACRFLQENMGCSVYKDRPIECRLYNVVDLRVFESCDRWKAQDRALPQVALREMIYRLLFSISTEMKTMNQWFSEGKNGKGDSIFSACGR